MPGESVAIVPRNFEAFERGDLESVNALLAPDFEFVDLGERVLVRVRIEGTAFREGLIARLDIYRSWSEGRGAAGRH